jgi:hypothetical protein
VYPEVVSARFEAGRYTASKLWVIVDEKNRQRGMRGIHCYVRSAFGRASRIPHLVGISGNVCVRSDRPSLGRSLDPVQQIAHVDAQEPAEQEQFHEGGIDLSALDATDVRSVHTHVQGKRVLGVAGFPAIPPKIVS